MIKTTVARIFSPRHVALSAGAEQGVKEGMVFVIYALGEPITDPGTGESLGQLELVKGRVRVFYVQDKLCQAETFSRTTTEGKEPLTALMARELKRTVPEELKVADPRPSNVDLTVRVGDYARSVESPVAIVL